MHASMLCANPHKDVCFKVSPGEIEPFSTIKRFSENGNDIKN